LDLLLIVVESDKTGRVDMKRILENTPSNQAKSPHRRWQPGEPFPKNLQVNAHKALERNAAAQEREQQRQRFMQPRRADRGDRREAA
jgi:hypothetical protein